ncbi:MAG: LLM class flavin-dependent oxidoreductase [Acidimicrobiales bacterium]|jgi:5,10-methylenetetrahydromethanopterin reductase
MTQAVTASQAPLRLGVSLSNETPVADTIALAVEAEKLGFDEIWLPESSHGRGLFTVAAQLAANTERAGIGIGIVNPFWRHPSVIAMEAATLDEATGGRLKLGLGAALWTLRALGEADSRTERPIAAMTEAIEIVRAMVAGGPQPAPAIYTVRSDVHLDFPLVRPRVPIYVGAVNARMLQLSGALADGVELGAITSPGYTSWAWAHVAEGARSAGRDPASLDLVSNVLISVDHDARTARDATRHVLAYYLHRVEGVVVEHSGADPDQVRRIRQAVLSAGVAAGADAVTDDLIDVFAAAGDPDHVAARLAEFVASGLRGLLAWYVFGPDPLDGLALLASEVAPQLW